MTTYTITVSKPRPSMMWDEVEIEVDNYQDAVSFAHGVWLVAGRRTSVVKGLYHWHTVDYRGIATDRNHNSGVPEKQLLTPLNA